MSGMSTSSPNMGSVTMGGMGGLHHGQGQGVSVAEVLAVLKLLADSAPKIAARQEPITLNALSRLSDAMFRDQRRAYRFFCDADLDQ
eukprot:gene29769-5417_t